MKPRNEQPLRCAIYRRKSSEEGLEQDFNSLHAQREACEAYIRSQQGEGWRFIQRRWSFRRDDGASRAQIATGGHRKGSGRPRGGQMGQFDLTSGSDRRLKTEIPSKTSLE
jgi:hypothetical protein